MGAFWGRRVSSTPSAGALQEKEHVRLRGPQWGRIQKEAGEEEASGAPSGTWGTLGPATL